MENVEISVNDIATGENTDKLGFANMKEASPMNSANETSDVGDDEFLKQYKLKDINDLTPLQRAAIKGSVNDLRRILLACLVAVLDVTAWGDTVLHLTLKHNQYDAFVWLLGKLRQMKVEHLVNWVDGNGNTVLHLATSMKQSLALEALLPGMVNVNATNSDGLTALDLLHLSRDELGDRDICELLRSHGAIRAHERATSQPQPEPQQQLLSPCQWDFNEALQRLILQIPPERWPLIFVAVEMVVQLVYQVANNPPRWNLSSISGHSSYHIKDVILGYDEPTRVFYLMTLLTLAMIVAILFIIIFLSTLNMGRFLVTALFAVLISYGIVMETSMPSFFVICGTFHFSIAWLAWIGAIFLLLLVALAKHVVVLLTRFAIVVWTAFKGMIVVRGGSPNALYIP